MSSAPLVRTVGVNPSTGTYSLTRARTSARSEADCRDLSRRGSRVRLVKGAYAEPASVAFTAKAEVDEAYLRFLRILIFGPGYPMVATHDPRWIAQAPRHVYLFDGRVADGPAA